MKKQDRTGANTLCSLYFYDDETHKWVAEATIENPNDGGESVKTFGGGMNAFLENWAGQEKDLPKLATYRLWLGTSPADLAEVTAGGGDGRWGVLNGSFFLAGGANDAIDALLKSSVKNSSPLLLGDAQHQELTVHPRPLPKLVIHQLEHLDD